MTKSFALIAACAATLASLSMPAAAQTFPSRPVTWIVPFAAGGITDANARVVAKAWAEKLGQPVLVENRGGAGGNIGAQAVATSKPDGYTVVYGTTGIIASNKWMYKNLSYDPGSLVAVHGMADTPMVLVVNAGRSEKTLKDLIDTAKAQPNAIKYGSAGVGALTHLGPEFMQQTFDIKMTHVPYKGAGPAMTDLVAGFVQIMLDLPGSIMPQIEGGKIRALAVLGTQRAVQMPDVPTTVELGYPNLLLSSWSGIYAAAGTPQPIVDKLASTFEDALRDPAVQAYFKSVGSTVLVDLRGEAFKEFTAKETAKWKALVEKSGVTAE